MNKPNRKILLALSLFLMGFMVLALVLAFFTDLPKLFHNIQQIHVEHLIFALLCTGAAYLSFTLSFNGLFLMTPHRVPFPRFFSIMFISYTINFVVSSGGWAGIALRSYLLRHDKVPYSVTVPISFAQNMVFNLVLACFSFGGLIFLREHPEFVGGGKEAIVLGFMVFLVALVAVMLLLFIHGAFRKWVLRSMIKAGSWGGRVVLRKNTSRERLVEIRNDLERTIQFLHRGWLQLFVVFFWCAMDWTFTALTLYFCFRSVGVVLPLGQTMLGFTVMFLTSTINPVPAGLGISEAALAGVFSLLGVELEKTLVAALLFRFIFFLLPMAVSLGLYLDTLRTFLKSEEQIEKAVREE
ncbi:MAG TPA: lysylphosphatidylglycerol synthase transmembrane domain-containing protein [bacterium]|nr:lysylphosphatidylglycerol synthase transmembrane domain-containing protein [bacterium]